MLRILWGTLFPFWEREEKCRSPLGSMEATAGYRATLSAA